MGWSWLMGQGSPVCIHLRAKEEWGQQCNHHNGWLHFLSLPCSVPISQGVRGAHGCLCRAPQAWECLKKVTVTHFGFQNHKPEMCHNLYFETIWGGINGLPAPSRKLMLPIISFKSLSLKNNSKISGFTSLDQYVARELLLRRKLAPLYFH